MKTICYFLSVLFIALPLSSFAGEPLIQSNVNFLQKDNDDNEVYAYYDLRDRKSYIQLTTSVNGGEEVDNQICVHVQIFQQDKGCVELDFEDVLTINDTVIYDMDNILRNNGSEVPINLDENSYGFVAFSAYDCDDNDDSDYTVLLGNFRIVDDSGYEYRMNLFTDDENERLSRLTSDDPNLLTVANVIIPFNTVDGAKYTDIVGFLVEDNRSVSGQAFDGGDDDDSFDDQIYNEKVGVTFDVFQVDENEERLSCDRKTIGCGPNVTLNYGINEDYRNSRGGPLLCEGASLLPGQQHGYISLENATSLSPLDTTDPPANNDFEFVCIVGLNNGDGTGSMDSCTFQCIDDDGMDNNCELEF